MISDEDISALKAKHGRIKHATFNNVDLVFRRPSRAECQMYMMKRDAGGSEKIAADEQIAQILIVRVGAETDQTKSRMAFLALLEDFPLLTNEKGVGSALSQLMGITQDDELKLGGIVSKPSADPPTPTP